MKADHESIDLMAGTALYNSIRSNIALAIAGQEATIRLMLSAFLSGGHVLLEDFPGTGKTTLAKALARTIGVHFQRIQFTSDLLPSDILGVSVYNQKTGDFEIRKGPVFSNILLADEINRASPRTQSALLEAMGEAQISLEGEFFPLESPFFVIATQNPLELHGTYPLPEAQMDRFALRLGMGYVSVEDEVAIIRAANAAEPPLAELAAVCSSAEVRQFRRTARRVTISAEISRYLVSLVSSTREHPDLIFGASPRASLTLLQCAQALAVFDGSTFVTPDHIQELAPAVLAHRLAVKPESAFSGATAGLVVAQLLERVTPPR